MHGKNKFCLNLEKQITITAHFWCGMEGELMAEKGFFPHHSSAQSDILSVSGGGGEGPPPKSFVK
jgi:hypothetical protein